jgi:hypothetical protein
VQKDTRQVVAHFDGILLAEVNTYTANAALLAAAPDMLEALKKITGFAIAHTSFDCEKECVCGFTAAMEAIKKAEGRS